MKALHAALASAPPQAASRAAAANDDRVALQRACTALWMATLALMTAFMHNSAPAHRYLIARKIAKNLSMLHREDEVFTTECRMIFNNLAQRWNAKADQLAPRSDQRDGGIRLLQPARLRTR